MGSTQILAELAGAAALLIAFLLVERRAREPMLPPRLFRLPAFAGAQMAVFAMSASFFALFLYTTLYLQNILRLSPLDAGLVYLPGTILLFVVSGASAELMKRIPARTLIWRLRSRGFGSASCWRCVGAMSTSGARRSGCGRARRAAR